MKAWSELSLHNFSLFLAQGAWLSWKPKAETVLISKLKQFCCLLTVTYQTVSPAPPAWIIVACSRCFFVVVLFTLLIHELFKTIYSHRRHNLQQTRLPLTSSQLRWAKMFCRRLKQREARASSLGEVWARSRAQFWLRAAGVPLTDVSCCRLWVSFVLQTTGVHRWGSCFLDGDSIFLTRVLDDRQAGSDLKTRQFTRINTSSSNTFFFFFLFFSFGFTLKDGETFYFFFGFWRKWTQTFHNRTKVKRQKHNEGKLRGNTDTQTSSVYISADLTTRAQHVHNTCTPSGWWRWCRVEQRWLTALRGGGGVCVTGCLCNLHIHRNKSQVFYHVVFGCCLDTSVQLWVYLRRSVYMINSVEVFLLFSLSFVLLFCSKKSLFVPNWPFLRSALQALYEPPLFVCCLYFFSSIEPTLSFTKGCRVQLWVKNPISTFFLFFIFLRAKNFKVRKY